MANQDQSAGHDELNHETDLGRSFQKPNRPSFNLSRGSSSFNEHRPMPADEHDGYSAVKYYSTFQEPGKQQHATHGSAGDLAALDQVEDPQRTASAYSPLADWADYFQHQMSDFAQAITLNRPQSASVKPGRSDVEERLENDPNTTTSSTTTSSYSVKPGKGSA